MPHTLAAGHSLRSDLYVMLCGLQLQHSAGAPPSAGVPVSWPPLTGASPLHSTTHLHPRGGGVQQTHANEGGGPGDLYSTA
jgi:hypothetical protein